MKKYFRLVAVVPFLLFSCQKTQENSPAETEDVQQKGITVDEVYTTINDVETDETTFAIGQRITYIINGVKGLKEENGIVYPGMELTILNHKQDTVLHQDDLLESLEGYMAENLALRANFRVAFPYTEDPNYVSHVRIWDKKGDGYYTFDEPFSIKENPAIQSESNGIQYRFSYLYNVETKSAILNENVKNNQPFQWIIEGLNGYTLKDGKAFLKADLKITGENENTIVDNPDFLGDQTKLGVTPDEKGSLTFPVDLVFDKKVKGKVKAVLKIQDTLSEKNVVFTLNLMVEDK